MKHPALWLAGFVLSVAAHVSAAAPLPAPAFTLIELGAFTCERCQRFDREDYDMIASAVKAAGGELDFAPLPQSQEATWAPRMYYAARIIPGESAAVRKALFSAAELNVELNSGAEVVAWLEQQISGVYWGRFLQAVVAHKAGIDATGRAAKLYMRYGGGEFPIFIALKDGQTSLVARGGSLSDIAQKVQTWLSAQTQ